MMLILGLAGVEDGSVLRFGGDGHVEIEGVGGLLTSTAVTLLFLPAFYEWFAASPAREESHG